MASHDDRSVSQEYLFRRLALLQERVAGAVAARQQTDPEPEDRFRGLYVSREQAARLFDGRPSIDGGIDTPGDVDLEGWAAKQEADGHRARFLSVCGAFDLTRLDADILMIALGPDLDPRLERAYGYLHDDVSRRRASVGLAIELCGGDLVHPASRARLSPDAPLVAGGLLMIEDGERPFLTRSLRVPDIVAGHLLGDDVADPVVAPIVTTAVPVPGYDTAPITRALEGGVRLVYLRDHPGTAALSYAAQSLRAAGRPLLALDLRRLTTGEDSAALAKAAIRRVRMDGGVLVADGIEVLAEMGPGCVRDFAEAACEVILIGSRGWDPLWSRRPALCLDAPAIVTSLDDRLAFRLTPEQAERARQAARDKALAMAVPPDLALLSAGAREQNAAALDRLALRIAPAVGWDDLVLPEALLVQLRELLGRVQHRHRVFSEWGMRRARSRASG